MGFLRTLSPFQATWSVTFWLSPRDRNAASCPCVPLRLAGKAFEGSSLPRGWAIWGKDLRVLTEMAGEKTLTLKGELEKAWYSSWIRVGRIRLGVE